MRILEIIILTFCAIIMGGFIVDMICFVVAIVVDEVRDRYKNNRKIDKKGDEYMIIYDDDGVGRNVVPMKVIDNIKQDILKIEVTPFKYCHDIKREVFEIIDKHLKGEE